MLPGDAVAGLPLLPTQDQLPTVPMRVPPDWCGGQVYGTSGKTYQPVPGAILDVQPDDAAPLRRLGFVNATPSADGATT
jgi:hypothetical protein